MEKSVGMLSRAFGGLVEYWRPFAVEEADEVTARKTCAVGRIILRDFILSINLHQYMKNYEVKRSKIIYIHSSKALKYGESGRGGLIGYLRLAVGVATSSPSRFQTLIVAQAKR